MARRYYLAPVTGSGSHDDPYRADLPTLGGVPRHACLIPTDGQGAPRYAATLVQVGAGALRHAAMSMSGSYVQLPDDRDAFLTSSERGRIVDWLRAKGVSADVPAVVTVRQVLHHISLALDATPSKRTGRAPAPRVADA